MDHDYQQLPHSSITQDNLNMEEGSSGNGIMPSLTEFDNLLPDSTSPSTSKHQHNLTLPDGIVVNIQVHNILCNYNLPMHIDLRQLANRSINVDYDRAQKVLVKQLRNPPCIVKIYNSGKVVIVNCKSEDECKRASRSTGRMIQRSMGKLDQKIRIRNYRVSNILATCRMPFGVRIEDLARKYRSEGAKYEPELMIGLQWALKEPKASLRIHTTGTITITGATSEDALKNCVEKVYPYLKEFSCPKGGNAKNVADVKDLLTTNQPIRRPPQKHNNNGRPNGCSAAKKPRIGEGSSGVYNDNQIYFPDEDEDAMGDVEDIDDEE